jgi:hypothetical protein
VRNPIGYLATLCHAAQAGHFQLTSLGLRARQAREHALARHRALARQEASRRQALVPASAHTCALAQRLLAIRDRVKTSPPPERPASAAASEAVAAEDASARRQAVRP